MVTLTPGMQQYMDIKNANPDCIILFRMGDFYETFFDDAVTIARELEITLTSRGQGDSKAPLAGIPYHAIEPYLAKLVKKGYKVGIVEQTEDPKFAKGLVKRELVRIITPGTVVDSSMLNNSSNNYILSFVRDSGFYGMSFCDISTGEFQCAILNREQFLNEVRRIHPAEIIYPTSLEDSAIEQLKLEGFYFNSFEARYFWADWAENTLKDHFGVLNLEGFGIKSILEISAAGAIISYLKETQKKSIEHIHKISEYNINHFMYLDSSSIRNLELLKNVLDSENATLLGVLDKTLTPMGKRLIRKWIVSPLLEKEEIIRRIEAVKELKENLFLRENLKKILNQVYDIERLIGRISYGNCNPKDLVSLKTSLENLPEISELLLDSTSDTLKNISKLPNLEMPKNLINTAIKEEPSTLLKEGNIIRSGYNSELDELREITKNVKTYLAELEEREKERTGIKSLKIRYNKVIGYFIEITKSYLNQVPDDYIRKQTQVNSERFVTEELKEKENKILGAQERIYELEFQIFSEIVSELKRYIIPIQDASKKIARLDVLNSFATTSDENNYCEPIINENGTFEINEGRHPVIEAFSKTNFIPNDCNLHNEERTMIITGPNMAGKSTYLRQNALIVLMAQIGCFVPASSANIPVFDRIFSRIGAYDNLVREQSTFMVEMNETANILNNATEKSFVILDEIGRGTSTYDGVSLAWAIAEYLNNNIKCKSLFATHYHYLNRLKEKFSGIDNYHIMIQENDDEIIFLRKIGKGGTDKSYGIHVAKLAGVPEDVISRAKIIQIEFEENQLQKTDTKKLIEKGREIAENILAQKNELTEKNKFTFFGDNFETTLSRNLSRQKLIEEEKEAKEKKLTQSTLEFAEKSRIEKLEDEIKEIKELLKKRY